MPDSIAPNHCPFCLRDMTPEAFDDEQLRYTQEGLDSQITRGWNVGCRPCGWWGDILWYEDSYGD